jgi:TonB family protein
MLLLGHFTGLRAQAVQEPIKLANGTFRLKLVSKIPLTYPAAARKARVQGDVWLRATIDRDGKVKHLDVVEGPALLVDAAKDTVKQWIYEPHLVEGEPRAIQTLLTVRYSFSDNNFGEPQDPRLMEIPRMSIPDHLRVMVDPTLTAAPHGKGVVCLDLIIGTDGNVEDAIAVHGPPALVAVAESTVKQWKYDPVHIRGQLASVVTRVSFDFQ